MKLARGLDVVRQIMLTFGEGRVESTNSPALTILTEMELS